MKIYTKSTRKNSKKWVALSCDNCGKEFERELREHTRNSKKGMPTFCNLKCKGLDSPLPPAVKWTKENNPRGRVSQKDEYSPFREHLRKMRYRDRSRGREIDVDAEHLKEVFENQSGKCIYSGVVLDHRTRKKNNPLTTASVDRIDSGKGYVKGNVQFVSIACNHAKGDMPHEQMVEWINLIKNEVT